MLIDMLRCFFQFRTYIFVLVLVCVAGGARAQWREATGPTGGMLGAVAIDPLDADNLYVGGRELFHSIDGGVTWRCVEGPEAHGLSGWIRSIAISGDPDGPIIVSSSGNAVISPDRGQTWRPIERDRSVNRYAVGSAGSGVFYAYGPRVIARSADGGVTWSRIAWQPSDGNQISFFATDRFDADTLFLACGQEGESEFRFSRDGGVSFTRALLPGDMGEVECASSDPEDADVLYVWVGERSRRNGVTHGYYSYDSGRTWEVFWRAQKGEPVSEATRRKLEQIAPATITGPYAYFWLIKATHENAAWAESRPGRVILRAPGNRLVGSDDFGDTWVPIDRTLVAARVDQIVFDPCDRAIALCSTTHGVWRTDDRGASWHRVPIDRTGTVRHLVFAPDGKNVFVVAFGVWRGTRDGRTWKQVCERGDNDQLPVAIFFEEPEDEGQPPTAIVVGDDLRMESNDGGVTWQPVGTTNLERNTRRYSKGCVRRVPGETPVWLLHDPSGFIVRSVDAGRTWTRTMSARDQRVQDWAMAADGAFWRLLKDQLVVQPVGDGAEAIVFVSDRTSLAAVACDPADAKRGYLAQYGGRVLRTTDGGRTFEQLEGGPSGMRILCLAVSPHDGSLWVGTDGNGVWILDNPTKQPGKALGE